MGEQAKHTPGPWVIRDFRPEFDNIFIYAGQEFLADVSAKISSANAHLVASAPDMLAALQEAALQLQYLADKFQPTGTGMAVLARVEAAITYAHSGDEDAAEDVITLARMPPG